jgi:hypothetical protein
MGAEVKVAVTAVLLVTPRLWITTSGDRFKVRTETSKIRPCLNGMQMVSKRWLSAFAVQTRNLHLPTTLSQGVIDRCPNREVSRPKLFLWTRALLISEL